MDIRSLRYFLAVAEEGSILKGAKRLNMTQPPLSRAMKELEEEVGKPLFARGKKITLTEEGKLLRTRAEELIDLFEKTEAEIKSSENEGGEIYIGAGETPQIEMLAKAASFLQKECPKIRYRLYSGDAEHIEERLDKGLLDFGLLIGKEDMSKYDYIRLPKKDRWGLLLKKDDPLAQKENILSSDLAHKPLIMSHQASISEEMRKWFGKDFKNLNMVGNYDLLYNASIFVKNTGAYLIGLDGIINTSPDSDLAFRPLYPILEVELSLVYKKSASMGKTQKRFLEAFKMVIEED